MRNHYSKYLALIFVAFGTRIAYLFEQWYFYLPIFMTGWLLGAFFIEKFALQNENEKH